MRWSPSVSYENSTAFVYRIGESACDFASLEQYFLMSPEGADLMCRGCAIGERRCGREGAERYGLYWLC